MTKKRQSTKTDLPEWASRVSQLRQRLDMSQAQLGRQLQYSAMAISRWERGKQPPPADCYIKLADLAGNPDCWYFWECAGLKASSVIRLLPKRKRSAFRANTLDIVHAGSGKNVSSSIEGKLLGIRLLNVQAGAHGETGDNVRDLSGIPTEDVIAARAEWCPNPGSTVCMRARGTSMRPLIQDGDILAADYSQTNHSELDGKIVVAWHENKGLTISRFKRYRDLELLEAESWDYEAVDLSSDRNWRIIARVLWWTRLAP